MGNDPRMTKQRVCLLYSLSGLVSLGYQVAWFRIYVDRFGSTNLTFALVLCNFIGGLGVGSLASRYVTDRLIRVFRINDLLRTYGLVELLVTATVPLTVLTIFIPAQAWGSFPYALHAGIYAPTIAYQLSQVGIAALCVFVPCFFMGVTFPLLCYAFREDRRFPSRLYAWNTLGACSGVLLCHFVLLRWVGQGFTLFTMLALNSLIGAYFLARGGIPGRVQGADTDFDGSRPADATVSGAGVLLTLAAVSGLLSGALEGDMFKRIWFLGGTENAAMSFVSFWAILAIFLASLTVRALPALKLIHIKIAFAAAAVCYAATWQFAYPFARLLRRATEGVELPVLSLHLARMLLYVGFVVFPTYLLVSLLLPYVCNRIQSGRRHLGLAYGINTLGFCVGIVAFTWIAPRVNIFYSMKLIMVLAVVCAVLLFFISERRRLAVWKPAAAAGVFAVGCVLTPTDFDPSYVVPGSPPSRYPVRAMKSNGAHTTYVVSLPDSELLYFDNHSMSGTVWKSQIYMRLMAHFPLLAHPHPEDALLIGFGVGNTASAIASHETIRRIDVVELNGKVVETAPEFKATNQEAYLDPRLEFILDDGRNFLRLSDRTYDLITSEPPPPMHVGVYRLYSEEYYRQVLAHLNSDGMMTQWLPTYQMPTKAVDLAVGAFVRVFPHTLLFTGVDREFILVGSPSSIDLRQIEQRFHLQPEVVADLERLGIDEPLSLIARVIDGDGELRRRYGHGRVLSDKFNDLAHIFQNESTPTLSYDPFRVLNGFEGQQLAMYQELRGVVTHLGRLRYHVRGFPADSLMTVRAAESPSVVLAGVDWEEIDTLSRMYTKARKAGRYGEAIDLLQQALAIADEQPELLLELADVYFEIGRHELAIDPLQRFRAIEPDEAIGPLRLGQALAAIGRNTEAQELFEEARRLESGRRP